MDTITSDFENWGPYLMKQFQQMYDKGERCDLEISCNKQIFLVHRLILSACSEYVRDLGDKQHIILPDEISCKAVKSIIDFVYTGKIIFCKDEKEDLLVASNLLHMRLLTELIKMEESCSFTLSMDDENEESKNSENANVSLDLNDSTDSLRNDKFSEQPASSQTAKKKEVKGGRPRGNKNTILPPLFNILTDFVPSRLDVPDAILQSCPFQSSFEDISYGTSILCSYESMDAPLQPAHLQFLKKIKESPQKRSFASALFSPFDKYTPPYNMSSEMQNLKKRESVNSSYLSTIDVPAYKRPALKTSQTPKKSVTFAQDLEVIVEVPRSYPSDSPRRAPIQPPPVVEIPKPLPQLPETTAAIDVALETTPSDIDMELPAPLSPVTNFSGDLIQAPFVESGEQVELTNLRNVAMPMDIEELDHPTVIEYHPEPSAEVSPVTDGLDESAATKLPEDITMVDATEIETLQKDIPAATDEAKSSSEKSVASALTIEQITKEFEIEQQNPDDGTSSAEVSATEMVAEASAVNETEALPVDAAKLPTVSDSVAVGDPAAAQQSSSTEPAAKEVNSTETIHLSPPIIPPAAEIEQSLPLDDGICEEPQPSSSSATLAQPLSTDSAQPLLQAVCSTETTQAKVSASDQVATTTSATSAAKSVSSHSNSQAASSDATTADMAAKPAASASAPSTSGKKSSTTCPEEVILSDATVFTPLDASKVSHISTEPNSQIFAVKVKGTENQTQLSQLVDLCKNNPLFKNKNVKFKIVPVKGPLTKTLQERAQLPASVLNRAIIVQKSANAKCANAPGDKATAPAKTATVKVVSGAASRRHGRVSLVEKVTGPWECGRCAENGGPLKLASYFDYRTHLHEVHDEPNNPVYCMYCGYKSLKRNQQLYHLLSKHTVKPPANVHFPKCDKCDFHALNEYNLQKHQATHQTTGMEYVCSCRQAFKSGDLLQQHMASNACQNSRSFSCGYCNSQFGRVVNLKAHMRICMKERAKVVAPSAPVIEAIRPSDEEPEMIIP